MTSIFIKHDVINKFRKIMEAGYKLPYYTGEDVNGYVCVVRIVDGMFTFCTDVNLGTPVRIVERRPLSVKDAVITDYGTCDIRITVKDANYYGEGPEDDMVTIGLNSFEEREYFLLMFRACGFHVHPSWETDEESDKNFIQSHP